MKTASSLTRVDRLMLLRSSLVRSILKVWSRVHWKLPTSRREVLVISWSTPSNRKVECSIGSKFLPWRHDLLLVTRVVSAVTTLYDIDRTTRLELDEPPMCLSQLKDLHPPRAITRNLLISWAVMFHWKHVRMRSEQNRSRRKWTLRWSGSSECARSWRMVM